MQERTFVILKPDALQRGLAGEILARFERRGLKPVQLRLLQVSETTARRHYAEHEGKAFFSALIAYICAAPVIIAVLEGPHAIRMVRTMVGATNPLDATPGSIRADFGADIGRNLVHASDGPDTAATEIALWFGEDQVTWKRALDPWIWE